MYYMYILYLYFLPTFFISTRFYIELLGLSSPLNRDATTFNMESGDNVQVYIILVFSPHFLLKNTRLTTVGGKNVSPQIIAIQQNLIWNVGRMYSYIYIYIRLLFKKVFCM